MQGTDDGPVPAPTTRQLCRDLAAAGVAHAYLEIQGGGHDCAALLPPALLRRSLSCLVAHVRPEAAPDKSGDLRASPAPARELRISGSGALVTRLLEAA